MRYFILKMNREIFQNECFKQIIRGDFTTKHYDAIVYTFLVDVIKRVHFQLPQLRILEYFMSFFILKSSFFWPYVPFEEVKSNAELCQKIGLTRGPGKPRRELADEVIGLNSTIERSCRILFGVLRDSAYIGRLFQILILILNQR